MGTRTIVGLIFTLLIAPFTFTQTANRGTTNARSYGPLSTAETIEKSNSGNIAFWETTPAFLPADPEEALLSTTFRPAPRNLKELPPITSLSIRPGMTIEEFFSAIPVLKFKRTRLSAGLTVQRLAEQKMIVSQPTRLIDYPDHIEIDAGIKVQKPWLYSVDCQYFEVDKSKLPQRVVLKKQLSATDIDVAEFLQKITALQVTCLAPAPKEVASFTDYKGIEIGSHVPFSFDAIFVINETLHQQILSYIAFRFDDVGHPELSALDARAVGIPSAKTIENFVKELGLAFVPDFSTVVTAPEAYIADRATGGPFGEIMINRNGNVTAAAWEDGVNILRIEGYEGNFISRVQKGTATGAFGRELSLYYYAKSFPMIYNNLKDKGFSINRAWILDEDQSSKTTPTVISRVEPQYPALARMARLQGTVVLDVLVLENGLPDKIQIIESLDEDLDAAAIAAVRKWKFEPATKNGKPVASQTTVRVTFKL